MLAKDIDEERSGAYIESEPRVRCADEDLHVLPPAEVAEEVAAGSLGRLDALNSSIGVDVVRSAGEEVVDILSSLVHVTLDIHGETRCLRDGETEVKSDNSGHGAEPDDDTPDLVDSGAGSSVSEDRRLVGDDSDERNKGSSWPDD